MLQVKERRHRLTQAFTLSGQFDHRAMTGIQAMIGVAQETGRHNLVLDFSGVTEIDSSSLSELFLWYHNTKSQQIKICVVKPSPYIRYHEDWTHLAEIVSIYRSLDEALDQVDPG
ncbi:MAG: STAS domain-containing protein [Nitrospirales bacterium]